MGANAAANNRLLHSDESTLANKLASSSGGKYTQQQIEEAMRIASNTVLGETPASNMIINPTLDQALGNNSTDPVASKNFDKGAVFNNVNGSIVQVNRDGSPLGSQSVDPALVAFIQANTGGANSPYKWVTPLPSDPVDPNVSIKMTVSPSWNYMGANSAGMPSGVITDNRTQAQVDAGQCKLVCGIAGAPITATANALTAGGLQGTAAFTAAKSAVCTYICN
jgi:hypothetical protein